MLCFCHLFLPKQNLYMSIIRQFNVKVTFYSVHCKWQRVSFIDYNFIISWNPVEESGCGNWQIILCYLTFPVLFITILKQKVHEVLIYGNWAMNRLKL